MSLKTIKPKHREIMRRMLTYQAHEEISQELRVSTVYLNMLMRDPLFLESLEVMEADIHDHWKQSRVVAMDVLENSASAAATLCANAVDGLVPRQDENGNVDYEIVKLDKRLSSAWDVLNRTGNKAPERKVVAHTTLQEMIIAAYQQRNGEGGGGDGVSASRALAPSIISPEAKDPNVVDIEPEDENGLDEYEATDAFAEAAR